MKYFKKTTQYPTSFNNLSNGPHPSCILCGKESYSAGLLFKGHRVCEECLNYVTTKLD